MERIPRLLALLIALALGVSGTSGTIAAGPDPQSGPRSVSVSVPPEPVSVEPGMPSVVNIRVLNPDTAPVIVAATPGYVQLGDEGTVTVTPNPDPLWQGKVSFPPGWLGWFVVPANGFLDVPLTVRVPAQLTPDLYFVGFFVTPLATGTGSLKIVNRVGSFVTLDVPGARYRELSASLGGSGFVLGSQGEKTLRVRNVGGAVVQFWAENDTSSSPGGGAPHQERFDKSILPVGHERSLTVVGKPTWPVDLVTTKVHVFYSGVTEDSTKEIVLTKRALVVNPLVPAAVLALIAAAIAWWAIRRRRSRRSVDARRQVVAGTAPEGSAVQDLFGLVPADTTAPPRGARTLGARAGISGASEVPDLNASAREEAEASSLPLATLARAGAAVVVLGAGGWLARRRWLR
jgi:hypothetical protein